MKMHSVSKLILRSWPEKWQRQKLTEMKTSLKIVCGEQAEIKQLLSVKNLHEKYPLLKSEKWVSKNVFFHALAKVFKNAQHLP